MKEFFKNITSCLKNQHGNIQFSESIALKAVSLLLALILWITILGFKREEIKKNVKLEPLLPPGMIITNKIPTYIQFTLSGPRVWLKEAERKIQPIRPDLRRSRDTTIGFSISEDLIGDLPVGVKVTAFSPSQVLIRLDEVVERYITVKPTFSGNPRAGFELSGIKVIPSKIAVSGPKNFLQSLESVSTEPFDIEDLLGRKDGVISVEVDSAQGLQLSRDKTVKIRVFTKQVKIEKLNGEPE